MEPIKKAQKNEKIPAYIKYLDDQYVGTRQLAIFMLGKAGKTQLPKTQLASVIKSLGGRLKKEEDTGLKNAIVIALGEIKHPKTIPYLGEMSENKDHYIKQSAIYYLGETLNPKALPYITKAVNDNDYRIRRTAFEAMRKIKSKGV
jgi:HEAT repeat protein